MTAKTALPAKPGRSEQRRQQVLDAAAACFQRAGFRGASMADISEGAGMSTGHIYHYFKSKEAIVEAIVERDQKRGLDIIEELKNTDDVLAAMIDKAGQAVDNVTRANDPALTLEIFAEAARNPVVGEIVKDCAGKIGRNLQEALEIGQKQGTLLAEADPEALSVLLHALFSGLTVRAALEPDFDREPVLRVLRLLFERFLRPGAG
ncbi:MAG: TetR/AcrR family transcriptional regulator [Magnetospirillum sp.]|nr:TetR/AcrR family transcriptional regulator [Magnetospirillum sp.]